MSSVNTTTSSSTSSFSGVIALGHTVNSGGTYGSFVNPSCSCQGCEVTTVIGVEQPCIWANRPFGPVDTNERCPCRSCTRSCWSSSNPCPCSSCTASPSLLPSSNIPTSLPPPREFSSAEEVFLDGLRGYRATLQLQQASIGLGTDNPTPQQRAEWDALYNDLQDKIRAIEDCLLAFGSFFRTG